MVSFISFPVEEWERRVTEDKSYVPQVHTAMNPSLLNPV